MSTAGSGHDSLTASQAEWLDRAVRQCEDAEHNTETSASVCNRLRDTRDAARQSAADHPFLPDRAVASAKPATCSRATETDKSAVQRAEPEPETAEVCQRCSRDIRDAARQSAADHPFLPDRAVASATPATCSRATETDEAAVQWVEPEQCAEREEVTEVCHRCSRDSRDVACQSAADHPFLPDRAVASAKPAACSRATETDKCAETNPETTVQRSRESMRDKCIDNSTRQKDKEVMADTISLAKTLSKSLCIPYDAPPPARWTPEQRTEVLARVENLYKVALDKVHHEHVQFVQSLRAEFHASMVCVTLDHSSTTDLAAIYGTALGDAVGESVSFPGCDAHQKYIELCKARHVELGREREYNALQNIILSVGAAGILGGVQDLYFKGLERHWYELELQRTRFEEAFGLGPEADNEDETA